MPIPVHACAHRPLTAEAVAALVALPAELHVHDDDLDRVIQQRGWSWEHDLVCDSFRSAYGHVLCTEGRHPFGHPGARHFLVFGQVYPVDPDDASMTNGRWLYGLMDDWQMQAGWNGRRTGTDQDCEHVLAQAARAVTAHVGSAPERTTLSSAAVVTGPALTHRIWRTPTHAPLLGPAADNGPYGYLTHLQLSYTPLSCGPDLPLEEDEDGRPGRMDQRARRLVTRPRQRVIPCG
ncbi:hypothetical protein [Streptomyces sp. DSM 40907]|uniref:hypothetical protein n=1 Tax=Streptomyces kutzneri TaxID=3051179 RepID=UPI0028D2FA21|nr:hypothetical protein [Streptomyces sp. DSM 40907]